MPAAKPWQKPVSDQLNITTMTSNTISRSHLEKDFMDLMNGYLSIPLKEIRVKNMLVDFVQVLKKHDLRLQADLSMVIKALITVEGSARILFPELDVMSAAEPLIRGLAASIQPVISGSGYAATCQACGDYSGICLKACLPLSNRLKVETWLFNSSTRIWIHLKGP